MVKKIPQKYYSVFPCGLCILETVVLAISADRKKSAVDATKRSLLVEKAEKRRKFAA
jgi:hypothetical protein